MSKDTVYSWEFQRLPGWFIAELEGAGIPMRFRWNELTEEQKSLLNTLFILLNLKKKGLIEIEYIDGEVFCTLTDRGDRLAERFGVRGR